MNSNVGQTVLHLVILSFGKVASEAATAEKERALGAPLASAPAHHRLAGRSHVTPT